MVNNTTHGWRRELPFSPERLSTQHYTYGIIVLFSIQIGVGTVLPHRMWGNGYYSGNVMADTT